MNEQWVGRDFHHGFSATVDRQTAKERAREIAQREYDRLLKEWEAKSGRNTSAGSAHSGAGVP
jgi:hypothetical protein